jgi:CRP-like cAMP-binding protein
LNRNLAFLHSFINISEDTFGELQKISEFKVIKANTSVAKAGNTTSKVYLLVSGIMRVFLSDEAGKEYNKNFFMPPCFVGSYTSLIKSRTF